MNLKNRLKPLSALALIALPLTSLGAGCSDLKSVQDAACCKEFEVGKDMSKVDFHVDASIKGSFSALASAASDLSAVATGSISDVTTACENIALDLGADPADPSVVGLSETDAMTAWCNLAAGQITAKLGAHGSLATGVAVTFDPPKCSASLSATANCQASCDVNASCDIKATPPKCEGGTLSIECSGGCTAEAGATLACTGSCSGSCKGSCKATVDATVDCKGKCDGTCTAGAVGGTMGTGIQADGSCQGQCDGTCTLDADAEVSCKGTCDGSCSAKCSGTATVKAKCDGNCDADYTPLKCEGGKLTGGCMVDADCQSSCNASASAKAECTPPRVSVTASFNASLSASGKLQAQAALASLEANLPKLVVVFKARGEAFGTSVSDAFKAGGNITGSGKLDAKAAVCGLLIVDTIGTASANFGASLSAAGTVMATVTSK